MAPAGLYGYGLSQPPKTPFRRLLWAVAILVLCGTLLPFVVLGIVEAGAGGRADQVIGLVVLLLPLLIGLSAALYALVRIARSRPRTSRGPGSD